VAVARLPRNSLPEAGLYHLTARSTGGLVIFPAVADREDFLGLLGSTAGRFGWALEVYCLMGTHYHLVLEATLEAVSHGMHRLNGTYSQRFNRRQRRWGHLFGSRYSAWIVRDEHHLMLTRRYVLDNPVRAGLCERAEDWPWSWMASSDLRRTPAAAAAFTGRATRR
jgi:REP-associated tyrosine transposase